MYPRTNYEMSESDLEELLGACKPVPVIMVGDYAPSSPQENANRAWEKLGRKMGFDYMTVRPIEGKNQRFFSAVPSETESQQKDRLKREAAAKRLAEINQLKNEIKNKQDRLKELEEWEASE